MEGVGKGQVVSLAYNKQGRGGGGGEKKQKRKGGGGMITTTFTGTVKPVLQNREGEGIWLKGNQGDYEKKVPIVPFQLYVHQRGRLDNMK